MPPPPISPLFPSPTLFRSVRHPDLLPAVELLVRVRNRRDLDRPESFDDRIAGGRLGEQPRRSCGQSQGGKKNRALHGQSVDRKSTRLNSSHANISYAVFCL